MEEKTKASKGASVTKAGTLSGQSPTLSKSPQLVQNKANKTETIEAGNGRNDSQQNPLPQGSSFEPPSQSPQDTRAIGEQIGRRLRTVYNDILAQPVPDRFLDLLRELEKDPK
jgi:hypothetical protein